MKLIGAIFILLATTGIGFEYARRLSERPRQLRQLKVAIQSLEAEMLYGLTPLAEASEHLAKQISAPLAQFFSRLCRLFTRKGNVSLRGVGKKAWPICGVIPPYCKVNAK